MGASARVAAKVYAAGPTGQVGSTTECYDRLTETVTTLLPEIDVTHRWSGQVIETPDGLPYIGQAAEHQYIATGFSGNGMTFGTLGAMIASDAILGRPNPWADLFEPGRSALRRQAWEYIKENADYPYYLIRDRFAGATHRALRTIPRGTGEVTEVHGQPAAVYRGLDGKITDQHGEELTPPRVLRLRQSLEAPPAARASGEM